MPTRLQKLTWALIATVWFGLDGCNSPERGAPGGPVQGLRPVYMSRTEARAVQTLAPQPMRKPGKIYLKDGFLFINEIDKGIHVIDNRNPENPVRLSFIAIPGNRDIAVKDNILYADNTVDLVALNIANPQEVKLAKRIDNVFPYAQYPAQRGVQFECPDPNKGFVIRWDPAELIDPQCFR